MLLRFRVKAVRSGIAQEIKQYEASLMQMASVVTGFTSCADMRIPAEHGVQVPHDDNTIRKAYLYLEESAKTISDYLDYLEQRTGLPAGGDPSLKKKVKRGQLLGKYFLQAVLTKKTLDSRPGMEFGLFIKGDLKIYGDHLLHRDRDHDPDYDPPIVNGRRFNARWPTRCNGRKWHFDHIYHPLRRVPGTPWHKFFGNLGRGSQEVRYTKLFAPEKDCRIKLVHSEVSWFIKDHFDATYVDYTQIFHDVSLI